MKWRNSKERELLASGGSRDQTLPNKNNPNPDLSDARNDRPPSLSPNSEPASPTLDIIQQTPTANDQFEPGATSLKLAETKYQPDALGKFDGRKPGNPMEQMSPGNKNDNLFKMEFEDSRPGQQHIFNHFYEKVRDINTSMVFNSRTGSNGGTNHNLYYDEYESRSDSDEEISVT